MSTRRALPALLAAALVTAAAGCGPSPQAEVPTGFAVIDAGEDFAFRTANGDGVVVAVRSEENRPRGDLAFWAGALERRLERRGYARKGSARSIESEDGEPGRLTVFEVDAGGRAHVYWLGVFVTADHVFVVEATGDAAALDPATRAQVESTIASVDLDA